MDPAQVVQLLVSLAMLGLQGGIFVFFLVLTILSFRQLRQTWKWSVFFSLIALLLGLPGVMLGMYYVDVQKFAPGTDPGIVPAMKILACLVAIGIVAFTAIVRVMYYHVAAVQWSRAWGTDAPTIVNPGRARWRGLVVGAGIGTAAAAASLLLFLGLHIGESRQITQFMANFPGIDQAPAWIAFVASLGVGLAAAVVEELVFRGGILGFLCRITANQTALAWLWIAITAALWAFLHYDNTDRPAVKMTQIFLIGLAFGWLARRWGLHASMAGHIMLNAVVVAAAEWGNIP